MIVSVVYLQNFFPRGVIKDNFINKVNIYDTYGNTQSILINNIYNDLIQKIDLLDDYVYILNNKKVIITPESIKNLVEYLVTTQLDQSIVINHKNGSANGRYVLNYYLTTIK